MAGNDHRRISNHRRRGERRMMDPRVKQLAKNLVRYSVRVEPGENVLIEMIGPETAFVKALVDEVLEAGGRPYVELTDPAVMRRILLGATEDHMRELGEIQLARMERMQAFIGIRAGGNASELADVPADKMKLY